MHQTRNIYSEEVDATNYLRPRQKNIQFQCQHLSVHFVQKITFVFNLKVKKRFRSIKQREQEAVKRQNNMRGAGVESKQNTKRPRR